LTTTAVGADNVLSVIPEDSLGFAVVQRIDEVDKKVSRLSKLLDPPEASVLDLAKIQLDVREGIDETGSLAFVALPPDETNGLPAPIVFIPTSNYASLVNALKPDDADAGIKNVQISGRPFVVGQKGSYAVLAPGADRSRLRNVLDSSTSIAQSVKPLRSWRRVISEWW
jgi:hypothetical protein